MSEAIKAFFYYYGYLPESVEVEFIEMSCEDGVYITTSTMGVRL